MLRYHVDGSKPNENQVFVFGSNLAGRHGAGAALYARSQLGAEMGVFYGYSGDNYKSFAIPTKDEEIRTLPLLEIKEYVDSFVSHAKIRSDLDFFMTRIGCVLAGYTDEDIVSLFNEFPENVSWPENWKSFIERKVCNE